MTDETTARDRAIEMDELRRVQDYFQWCWDCGARGQDCRDLILNAAKKCCPDCRHRLAPAVAPGGVDAADDECSTCGHQRQNHDLPDGRCNAGEPCGCRAFAAAPEDVDAADEQERDRVIAAVERLMPQDVLTPDLRFQVAEMALDALITGQWDAVPASKYQETRRLLADEQDDDLLAGFTGEDSAPDLTADMTAAQAGAYDGVYLEAQLAAAQAAIQRVLAVCDDYDARAKRRGIIRHLSTAQVRELLALDGDTTEEGR